MDSVASASPGLLTSTKPGRDDEHGDESGKAAPGRLPLWRVNMMRVGYVVLGVGLAIYKWPGIIHHAQPWPLMDGVVGCMLLAMSLLALVGLRYPVQLLPVLLFESAWKVIWLAIVAVPLWTSHRMDPATWQLATEVFWVALILAVIPWRYVYTNYLVKRGHRWH